MSVLFCHDHRFVILDGAVYSSGQFSAATFAAYGEIFGEVTVAARTRTLFPHEDPARLSPVFPTTEHFVALPSLSTIRNLVLPNARARDLLRREIRANDLVVARLPSEIGLLALREARAIGRPVIVEVVGCARDALGHHGALGAGLYAPIAYHRMRRAVRGSAYVHYVSGAFLQERYPTRGRNIGVSDVEIARPSPDVLERRLASINDDRPVVFGMIAALFHRQKGVGVAIRALARAIRADPRLTLRILGAGDAAPWQKLAEREGVGHAVEFCGVLPRGQAVLDWIDGIDVYVQASFQEGLPRALIEAMRQGTPALASSSGGTPELVESAWLHSPGDVDRLAAQMLLARSAARRQTMARTNFQTSLRYGIDVVQQQRAEFWREVADDVLGQRVAGEPYPDPGEREPLSAR